MPESALKKAMDLLAARPLTESELRTRLSAGGKFPPAEVEEAVVCCRDRGYLNDALLASDAARYLSASGRGRGLIRKKLRARGVSEENLAGALGALSAEDEAEAARSAGTAKLRLLTREKDGRKKREKLFRFLISRGFSPETSLDAMSELLGSTPEDSC
jgi:regulatory protein